MTDSSTQTNDLSRVMADCLNLDTPKSFFLFAGAGSGKTRALVEAMKMFRKKHGQEFRLSARKVAVITYTNAACDEIKHRIDYDPIFAISTIHSFAWELIRSYHNDIREWLSRNLKNEINALEQKQQKGRAGKAANERAVKIELKQKRRVHLGTIRYFTYNPNGENVGKNSLNHTEVIGIAAEFLSDKPLMQKILIRKYPVLLIDESQDTQKNLVDAFFAVQSAHSGEFCLALFGDTMQRIYADGKLGLEKVVPNEWKKPAISVNHRCPKRIVRLINMIRAETDGQEQKPREDAPEGFVRLFLVQDDDGISKAAVEAEIAEQMAAITSDDQWSGDNQEIKTLTLEHHMAARRGGFNGFFVPLYQVSKFKTGLLDGTLSGIPFFSQQILPLVEALRAENKFNAARIIKKYSPLLSAEMIKASKVSIDQIRKSGDAQNSLFSLWDDKSDPTLMDILLTVADNGLFAIPDVFAPILYSKNANKDNQTLATSEPDDKNPDIEAWRSALSAPFSQLKFYVQYISDQSPFGTHQGIKGLQFPRVMVILDDNEARGFMFSFDKLLGAKPPTTTDQRNQQEGKETSVDRTRRLFYVTCSRAQSSLAVVVYTTEKSKIKERMKALEWFEDKEIMEFTP